MKKKKKKRRDWQIEKKNYTLFSLCITGKKIIKNK